MADTQDVLARMEDLISLTGVGGTLRVRKDDLIALVDAASTDSSGVEAERDEALDVIRSIRLYCENQGDKFRYHAGEILSRISQHSEED